MKVFREQSVRARWCIFTSLTAASVAISAKNLWLLAQFTHASAEYSYIGLVLPISIAFVYYGRAEVFSRPQPRFRWGIAAMIPIVLAALASHEGMPTLTVDQHLSIDLLLLVSFWIVAFCSCFGFPAAKKALFPLLFLYFLVPAPEPLMGRIVSVLQHQSANAADVLFQTADVPVIRQGHVFVLARQQIEVAKECSGIRSSTALLITALVFGHLFLRSKFNKAALAAIVVPLAIVKNGVRIFTLSVLATYVDPVFLSGPLHHEGGIVFFLPTLGALIVVLLLLRKLERPCPVAAPTT
ncbi:MAG TPA: exosortase/archaeosortase family protein [Terriglobales bacterium]|nr:exosortase/archaeosortase family protein [Terriglobales bacterium]